MNESSHQMSEQSSHQDSNSTSGTSELSKTGVSKQGSIRKFPRAEILVPEISHKWRDKLNNWAKKTYIASYLFSGVDRNLYYCGISTDGCTIRCELNENHPWYLDLKFEMSRKDFENMLFEKCAEKLCELYGVDDPTKELSEYLYSLKCQIEKLEQTK